MGLKRWVGALVLGSAVIVPTGVQAQGTWKPGPPIPQGANEVIGATVGGHLLVYGGQGSDGKPMGIFWKFDPQAQQWSQLPSNPVAGAVT